MFPGNCSTLADVLNAEFEPAQLRVDLVKDEKDLNHDTFDVVLSNTGEVLHSKSATDDDLGELNLTETEQLMMISKIGAWLASQPK